MGKLSRTKGAAFERYTAAQLRQVFPRAKRCRQSNTFDNKVDTPDVEAGPLDIECKHRKGVSRVAAIREAKEHCRHGRHWAAVIREHGASGADVEITMSLQAFIEMMNLERLRGALPR